MLTHATRQTIKLLVPSTVEAYRLHDQPAIYDVAWRSNPSNSLTFDFPEAASQLDREQPRMQAREQPCGAQSISHSPMSHTQCLHLVHDALPHHHNANICALAAHTGAPVVLSWMSVQLLQAVDWRGTPHTVAGLHVSTHHTPALASSQS